jgi:hypothetical protein
MSLLQKMATSGGVCGTVFVKIKWQPGMEPRLILWDAETVSVTLAEDDIDKVVAYKLAYPSIDPATKKAITICQLVEQDGAGWLITDQRGRVDGGPMETVGTPQKWPYAFSPVVYCQNMIAPHEFWGMSDTEDDLVEAIDKENFTVSNILKILRYHAHPKTWVTGVRKEDVRVNPDNMILLPTDASIGNLEMQSDMESSIQMYKELKQFVHELARVPEVATGKLDSIGQLSGVALEILYQPLLEKTEAKRVTYGEMIVELNRRLLALGGYGENNVTELGWQEMLPKDQVQMTTAAIAKKTLGVSADTLIQEVGSDPDIERAKKLKEIDLGRALLGAFDHNGDDTE